MASHETQHSADQPTSAPLGRLLSYELKGLFDRRTIKFELAESGPTVLTGANGSGKSTVLRTIDAVSSGDWASLSDIRFSKLTMAFSSGDEINVQQTDDGLRIERTDKPVWVRPRSTGVFLSSAASEGNYQISSFTANSLTLVNPILHGSGVWSNLTVDPWAPPQWVEQLRNDFPVLYVPDNRRVAEPSGTETVSIAAEDAASDIGRIVEMGLAVYPQQAQAIDRDFPIRVTTAMAQDEPYTDDQLQALLESVNSRQAALRSVGLLPEDELPLSQANLEPSNAKTVIKIFAEGMIKKLDSLESLRVKLSLFTTFINRHYQGKQIFINGTSGAVVIDMEAQEPTIIPASKLSSGEQQILILAHRVLFQAGLGTLVLIDEPELSLHVLWQDTFIDDITQMGAQSSLSFILATHSPTLVAGRDDLRRALDAQ